MNASNNIPSGLEMLGHMANNLQLDSKTKTLSEDIQRKIRKLMKEKDHSTFSSLLAAAYQMGRDDESFESFKRAEAIMERFGV